jgi:hypothetical protein
MDRKVLEWNSVFEFDADEEIRRLSVYLQQAR